EKPSPVAISARVGGMPRASMKLRIQSRICRCRGVSRGAFPSALRGRPYLGEECRTDGNNDPAYISGTALILGITAQSSGSDVRPPRFAGNHRESHLTRRDIDQEYGRS